MRCRKMMSGGLKSVEGYFTVAALYCLTAIIRIKDKAEYFQEERSL